LEKIQRKFPRLGKTNRRVFQSLDIAPRMEGGLLAQLAVQASEPVAARYARRPPETGHSTG
jgi:hypothetical protein